MCHESMENGDLFPHAKVVVGVCIGTVLKLGTHKELRPVRLMSA